jgi:hypothetical protein
MGRGVQLPVNSNRCAGFASYYGPCGCPDCSRCHPENFDFDEETGRAVYMGGRDPDESGVDDDN